MLRGDAARAQATILGIMAGALQDAWAGETPVNWSSPLYAQAAAIIDKHSRAASQAVLAKPIPNATDGAPVPYIKGKIPMSEIDKALKAGKAAFDELYPDANMSPLRVRKYRVFKANFVAALKALVTRWNHESEAYYPNGRRRKDVDGTGAAG